jgi:hypothetical protein
LLNSIISLQLSSSSCSKLLSGDGITTSDLTIKGVHGIFGPVSIDARSAKKGVPAIGDVASAAKNLDEYQFLICSMVPSLPDSNPSKMELQKYRVAIIAAFANMPKIFWRKHQTHALRLIQIQSCRSLRIKMPLSILRFLKTGYKLRSEHFTTMALDS